MTTQPVAASDVISLALLNPGPSGIQGKALVAGVPTVSAGSRLRERESSTYGAGVHVDLDAPSLGVDLDALQLAERARRDKAALEYHEAPNMFHDWMLAPVPEANSVKDKIVDFILGQD